MKWFYVIGMWFCFLELEAQTDCANQLLRQQVSVPAYWKALELTEEQLLT